LIRRAYQEIESRKSKEVNSREYSKKRVEERKETDLSEYSTSSTIENIRFPESIH